MVPLKRGAGEFGTFGVCREFELWEGGKGEGKPLHMGLYLPITVVHAPHYTV